MKTNGDKVVLVTGASSGIGKETAKALVRERYTVYAAARRLEKMEDLKSLGCIPLKMDITKEPDVKAVVETIKRDHGGVDVLVNNAGFAIQGPVEEVSIEDARNQYEVNLFGLARLTQLVLPYMREKKAGRIINVSSAAGKIYFSLGAWYVSTKHALEGWSDCLRLELKPFNIDVVIVEPGAIATEFNEVSLNPLADRFGKGPYSGVVNSFVRFSRELEKNPKNSSHPAVITDVIIQAIKSKHPKTRYAAGAMAKPMMFLRKWGGDCIYDWVVGKMVR